MRGKQQLALLIALSVGALASVAPVEAQGRRGGGRIPSRPVVVYGDRIPSRPIAVFVGGYQPFFGGYYRPFFDPYLLDPYPWYPYAWYPYQSPVFPPYGLYGGARGVDVRLQVTPRDAEVYVDGYLAGTVDNFDGFFQRLRVAPGDHEIVLHFEGYRSVRQNLHLVPGGTFKVRYDMVPLGPGESAEPRPVPATSATPGVSPPVFGGRVPAPAPASRFGTLSLRVQPPDADVRIDGEQWRGPEGQDRLLIQVSEGLHRVEVQKQGYQLFSTDVQARAGETVTLNVSLPPLERR